MLVVIESYLAEAVIVDNLGRQSHRRAASLGREIRVAIKALALGCEGLAALDMATRARCLVGFSGAVDVVAVAEVPLLESEQLDVAGLAVVVLTPRVLGMVKRSGA
jgi:hypothetical protein